MKCFVADFETTTDENDCRVWGYGISEIGKLYNFYYGNSIDDFMSFWESYNGGCKVYFHHLLFDGNFIINWLEANGFKFVRDRKFAEDKCYTTLITKDNIYYSIEVYFTRDRQNHKANRVIFYDSMKILNTSVEQIAKDFNLPIQKGSIDYHAKREIGHRLTTEEISYIRNDVEIVAMALDSLFKAGVNKNTIGTSAMEYFRETTPAFAKLFPRLPKEVDDEIRQTYYGGFTYVNPIYVEKTIDEGITLDCNSEYPYVMAYELFPVGVPKVFYGEYQYDFLYPLYMISFSCSFKLRDGKIPTVRIKDSPYYDPLEYLESSGGVIVNLIMTSVDYELFRENYDVENIKFHGGYKFKAYSELFKNYMEHWNDLKIKAKLEHNSSMYVIAKKMASSLYGKFGTHSSNILKEPVKMDDGVIHFMNFKKEDRRVFYTAVASFTTAYGRRNVIKTAQKVRDWSMKKYGQDLWCYTDTDSVKIRLINKEDDMADLRKIINIHKYKLGAWKIEDEFRRAKFIRSKCYIQEDYDGKLDVVISGFPKHFAPLLNFDNFKRGFTTKGMSVEDLIELAKKNGATDEQIAKINKNFKYKYVKGGVILEQSSYTLK